MKEDRQTESDGATEVEEISNCTSANGNLHSLVRARADPCVSFDCFHAQIGKTKLKKELQVLR